MQIGNRILRLRKTLNFTQEQLANAVGVSVPAVSKWETGSTMPDITLLAPIARKLKTDVNDLLSYQENLSDWEVDKLVRELNATFLNEEYLVGINKGLAYLKQYPNNNYLKLKVANKILFYIDKNETSFSKEDIFKLSQEAESILLDIFLNPHNVDKPVIHTAAISSLVKRYIETGKLTEAENLLSNIPEHKSNGRELLKYVYLKQTNYDDSKRITQSELLVDLVNITSEIRVLFYICLEQERYKEAMEFAEDYYTVTNTLKSPQNIPSELLLEICVKQKKFEEALNYFDKYIDEIIVSENSYDDSKYFDLIKESIQTWKSGLEGDNRKIMYDTILEKDIFKEFLEFEGVMDSLMKLLI